MSVQASLETWAKALSILGAAVAFSWGVFQYFTAQRAQAETRRIEATKPFLERQLKLYTEATQAAATLASSGDENERAAAAKHFWSLYWGELALVEDKQVEAAMVAFGKALRANEDPTQLTNLSLALAHACRDSLAESWGVTFWRNPHHKRAT